MDLARTPWPDVPRDDLTVAVPVGSFEQHGPHLPLDTDTRIATAVVRALAGVAQAPAIAYGASGEHEGFAGTISIGTEALEALLVEYGRSACRWARRVVFVNGHGGNGPALVEGRRTPSLRGPRRGLAGVCVTGCRRARRTHRNIPAAASFTR